MSTSRTRRTELASLIERAPRVAVASAILFGVSLIFAGFSASLVLGGVGIGIVAALTLVLSYRYHSLVSWLFWAVPVPALLVALMGTVASDGSVSVTTAMYQSIFPALFVAFGALWVFRGKLLRWLA